MAKVEYLTERNGTYYVRIGVPLGLRAKLGRRELKRSLKTKLKTEAIKRYPAVLAELKASLKTSQTGESVESLSQTDSVCLKDLFERVYQETQATELEMRERVYRCLSTSQREERLWDFHDPVQSQYAAYMDKVLAEGDIAAIAHFLSKIRGEYHIQAIRQGYEIGDVAELKRRAIEAVGSCTDARQLNAAMKTIVDAEIAALEALDLTTKDPVSEVVVNPLSLQLSDLDQAREQGPILSEAITRWGELQNWELKTRREREKVMGYFIEICEDRPIGSYTKEDGKKARDVFRHIPPNAHKMRVFKKLDIVSISEKAKKGNFAEPAPKNVNDKLNVVSAFFNWALNEYDAVSGNPIQGLKLRVKERARDQREPFTIAELNQLFCSPVYTGCRSKKQWSVPGSFLLKGSHLYWLPLVALFTGMRLAEIAFLEIGDVEQIEGVLCFRIRETETRRLKTANSKRDIPVHHMLKDIGLVEFMDKQRSRSGLLFQDVKMGPADNFISPESKRMNRMLDKVGLNRDKTSFHSFRHTFEDGCRNSDIPLDVMNALQGHSERGMSGRYGAGYSIAALNRHLQKLHYVGLNIENLKGP